MHKSSYFNYLLIILLGINFLEGCQLERQPHNKEFIFVQTQANKIINKEGIKLGDLVSQINDIEQSLNYLKFLAFISYLFSLAAIGASIYNLFLKSQRNDNLTKIQPSQSISANYPVPQLPSINSQQQFISREEFYQIINDLNISNQASSPNIKTTFTENNTPKNIEMSEDEFVEVYNNNPSSLLQNAIEVSENQDSIIQRHRNSNQQVVLEKVSRRRGSYWLLTSEEDLFLVPKENIKVTQYNYATLEALFICHNYQSTDCSNFSLIKPAKVSPLILEESWQLIEQGELEFN